MNIAHELKVHTRFFSDLFNGKKTFEVRKNDRGFKIGNILILRDYNDTKEEYNGGYIIAVVTYVLHGGDYGIEEGYVCMCFDIIFKEDSPSFPF
jgi:hypothetical protein